MKIPLNDFDWNKTIHKEENLKWHGYPITNVVPNLGSSDFSVFKSLNPFVFILLLILFFLLVVFSGFAKIVYWLLIIYIFIIVFSWIISYNYRILKSRYTRYAFTNKAIYIADYTYNGYQIHHIPFENIRRINWFDNTLENKTTIYFVCYVPPAFKSVNFRNGQFRFHPSFEAIPNGKVIAQEIISHWETIPKKPPLQKKVKKENYPKEKIVTAARWIYACLLFIITIFMLDFGILPKRKLNDQIISEEIYQHTKQDFMKWSKYKTLAGVTYFDLKHSYRPLKDSIVSLKKTVITGVYTEAIIDKRDYSTRNMRHYDNLKWLLVFFFIVFGLCFLQLTKPNTTLIEDQSLNRVIAISIALVFIIGISFLLSMNDLWHLVPRIRRFGFF
jgi:hypothetical protein